MKVQLAIQRGIAAKAELCAEHAELRVKAEA